jgi:hypothetical protein
MIMIDIEDEIARTCISLLEEGIELEESEIIARINEKCYRLDPHEILDNVLNKIRNYFGELLEETENERGIVYTARC